MWTGRSAGRSNAFHRMTRTRWSTRFAGLHLSSLHCSWKRYRVVQVAQNVVKNPIKRCVLMLRADEAAEIEPA